MTINNLVQLYKHANQNSVKTMLWVMSKIDYKKLFSRIAYSHENPQMAVKCVLLEYAYTTRAYSAKGFPNHVDYMPDSNVLVHHALNTPDFIRLIDGHFLNDRERVSLYTRQKIGPDGTPDFHRKQLVLLFEPWAFIAAPPEPILNPEES